MDSAHEFTQHLSLTPLPSQWFSQQQSVPLSASQSLSVSVSLSLSQSLSVSLSLSVPLSVSQSLSASQCLSVRLRCSDHTIHVLSPSMIRCIQSTE